MPLKTPPRYAVYVGLRTLHFNNEYHEYCSLNEEQDFRVGEPFASLSKTLCGVEMALPGVMECYDEMDYWERPALEKGLRMRPIAYLGECDLSLDLGVQLWILPLPESGDFTPPSEPVDLEEPGRGTYRLFFRDQITLEFDNESRAYFEEEGIDAPWDPEIDVEGEYTGDLMGNALDILHTSLPELVKSLNGFPTLRIYNRQEKPLCPIMGGPLLKYEEGKLALFVNALAQAGDTGDLGETQAYFTQYESINGIRLLEGFGELAFGGVVYTDRSVAKGVGLSQLLLPETEMQQDRAAANHGTPLAAEDLAARLRDAGVTHLRYNTYICGLDGGARVMAFAGFNAVSQLRYRFQIELFHRGEDWWAWWDAFKAAFAGSLCEMNIKEFSWDFECLSEDLEEMDDALEGLWYEDNFNLTLRAPANAAAPLSILYLVYQTDAPPEGFTWPASKVLEQVFTPCGAPEGDYLILPPVYMSGRHYAERFRAEINKLGGVDIDNKERCLAACTGAMRTAIGDREPLVLCSPVLFRGPAQEIHEAMMRRFINGPEVREPDWVAPVAESLKMPDLKGILVRMDREDITSLGF